MSRARRQGPTRGAEGTVVEARDVGDDRQEQRVEAAYAAVRRQGLKDQRVGVNKRSLRNARDAYDRLLAQHVVLVHGVVRARDASGVTYTDAEGKSAFDLHRFHENAHGRSHARTPR